MLYTTPEQQQEAQLRRSHTAGLEMNRYEITGLPNGGFEVIHGAGRYVVDDCFNCSCPDAVHNLKNTGIMCKHVIAVLAKPKQQKPERVASKYSPEEMRRFMAQDFPDDGC